MPLLHLEFKSGIMKMMRLRRLGEAIGKGGIV